MFSVVNGFTIDETGLGEDEPEGSSWSADAASMVRHYFASLPKTRFPHLTAVAGKYANVDQDSSFELLIDLFVDGLAQRASELAQQDTPRGTASAKRRRSSASHGRSG